MPQFNEEINQHTPIHDDAMTWDQFKSLLMNGEYEEDKIYFIQDVDTQADFLSKILEEMKEATKILQTLLEEDN